MKIITQLKKNYPYISHKDSEHPKNAPKKTLMTFNAINTRSLDLKFENNNTT
ncbi:hypothetical protein HPSAT_00880 [Helicobacter pylori Sat464]|nr:hypothetical protein HPSAT_00880 [Helicobacter pylori Sat464]